MRKVTFYSKFILSATLIFLFLNTSFSQIVPKEIKKVLLPLQPPTEEVMNFLNCNPVTRNGCNRLDNNKFTPSSQYNNTLGSHIHNPFNFDFLGTTLVTSWDIATGTPTVYDGVNFFSPSPPSSSTGYFFGGTGYDATAGGFYSESIVQKIPALTPNKAYTLSFFKMFKDYSNLPAPNNISNPLDHFRIVLMKCSDYTQTFRPITYQVPTLPANSQIIYCESAVSNGTWNQVFIKFTPNQAYDMMWIYPEGDHDVIPKYSGIFVSFPELIYVDNFSAGFAPNPSPGNCNVTIGPATPNCGPTGAKFEWTGPLGQTPNVPANQQITFDASLPANVGTWTLSMTMPNAVTTNNNCSQQQTPQNPILVSASVDVAHCISGPPQIMTSSYFEKNSGCSPTNMPVIPYATNSYCFWWECGGATFLESNYMSGNQWYFNNILINPPPLGDGYYDIPGIGQVDITNNTKKIRHVQSTSSGSTSLYNIQLKNTTGGYQQLTPPTYVRYVPTFFPNNFLGEYKSNYTLAISTYSAGPGAIYTWSIPNTIVTDIDNTTPEASVYFPINVPTPTITGSLTVTNSPYCNGVYNIFFTYNPALKSINQDNNLKENKIIIHPNPAINQIMISSTDYGLIQSVEIVDLFTPVLKKVTVSKTKTISINVSDLSPGIYNCKITTSKGIENQKLIIKR